MHNAAPAAIATWFQDEAEEEGMIEDHGYLWRHMAAAAPAQDFSDFQILDYGCNRGGFLAGLYGDHPFRRGIGVDVAEYSLALARQRHAALPLEFMTPEQAASLDDSCIDRAFSHEVLYLLPDLDAHAAAIARWLKPGAAYYAAIGCHTGNPLWPRWRGLIAGSSNLPLFDYSLDDYARAFWKAGLGVTMRPFGLQDFILIKPGNPYFPSAADSIHYHTQVKTLICARKAA